MKLTKEQLAKLESFKWRVWNTIKAPLILIGTGVVAKMLYDVVDTKTITTIFSWGYWDSILVLVAKLVLGTLGVGTYAGYDKTKRMK